MVASTSCQAQSPIPSLDQLTLIDAVGTCNAFKARFLTATGTFIGIQGNDACAGQSSTPGIAQLVQSMLDRAASGTVTILSGSAGYGDVSRLGSCSGMRDDFVDSFLGTNYTIGIQKPCDATDISSADAATTIKELIRRGIRPVARHATLLDATCDYTAGPDTYVSVLARIPKTANEWRTVCLTAGTYTSPLFLNQYGLVRLTGRGRGVTSFTAQVYYDPPDQGAATPTAPIDIRYSNNMVVQDMSIRNTVTYDGSGSLHMEVSRGLAVTGDNFIARNLDINTGGKQPFYVSRGAAHLFDSNDHAGYSLINGNYGTQVIDAVDFVSELPGGDSHPMVSSYDSTQFYRGVSARQVTGMSFMGALDPSATHTIYIENFSSSDNSVRSWVRSLKPAGQLSNAKIRLSGTYPSLPDRCYLPEHANTDDEKDNSVVTPSNPYGTMCRAADQRAQCNVATKTITLSWTLAPWASSALVRLDDTSNNTASDYQSNPLQGTSVTLPIKLDTPYRWWMHSYDGTQRSTAVYSSFMCASNI